MNFVGIVAIELRPGKLDEDFFQMRLDFLEHGLELIDFFFLNIKVILNLFSLLLIIRSASQESLLLWVFNLQTVILESQSFIRIGDSVDLLVKDIDVCEEIVVLFLSLDESVLDFFYIGESSCFFDCVEGLVDNFHVPLIIVDQLDFFFVVDDELGQPLLQDSGSVVLNCWNLSCLDSTVFVEFRVRYV